VPEVLVVDVEEDVEDDELLVESLDPPPQPLSRQYVARAGATRAGKTLGMDHSVR
jgi:hypothetical protein